MNAVLVVAPSWVGDLVLTQPLLALLKHREPQRPIDLLAPGWSRALAARMPQVRTTLELPFRHGELALRRRRAFGRALRSASGDPGYDWAIVLPGSWKSALVPFWADIGQRTGYVGELRYGLLNDARRLDRRALPMTVQRFAALGLPPGAPLPTLAPPQLRIDVDAQAAARVRLGLLDHGRPVLALCPGAEYGPAKRWPAPHYAAVAHAYLARDWQVWLFGSANDQPAAQAIKTAAPACIDLTGRTTLTEAVDLLACAAAVVSNDSGLMHIAAALGRPLVAVYGSSDPGFTPPLSPRAEVVRLGLPCSPCFQRECPLGHLDCLRHLEPARVLDALARVGVPAPKSTPRAP